VARNRFGEGNGAMTAVVCVVRAGVACLRAPAEFCDVLEIEFVGV
jgi:hypothetical protein